MKAGALILTISAVLLLGAGGLFTFNYINSSKIDDNQKSQDESSVLNETSTVEDAEPFVPPVYIEYGLEDIHKGKLILVNRDYEYVERSNADIVNIYSQKNEYYDVNTVDMLLDRTMISAINSMLGDFSAATGITNILANSGYRTYSEQEIMYNNDMEATGLSYSEFVAPPGYSEHHTGYAMDFAINDGYSYPALKNEDEYSWIYNNAHKYGMIHRYTEENKHITGYSAESWHFRYVGEPHSTLIKRMGLSLEEYVNFIKDYSFESPLEYKYSETEFYKIYFVKADFENEKTDVPVSYEAFSDENYEYSISGNNYDGFIVTLETSELSEDYDETFLDMFRPDTSMIQSETTDSSQVQDETEENSDTEVSESEAGETSEEDTETHNGEDEGW